MRSVLKLEDAIGRLFRSWGGEALYNSHEADPETGPLLRRVGTPCIWIVEVPIRQYDLTLTETGELFVLAYLANRGATADSGAIIEARIFEPLPPESIINVVRYSDAAFEKLTGCSTWNDLEGHLRDELTYAARGLMSEDGREARRAMREKRKPVFSGR